MLPRGTTCKVVVVYIHLAHIGLHSWMVSDRLRLNPTKFALALKNVARDKPHLCRSPFLCPDLSQPLCLHFSSHVDAAANPV